MASTRIPTALRFAGASLAVAVLVASGACAEVDRPTCYAGDYLACTCAGSTAQGFASCTGEGRYGACVCDGRTPGVDGSAIDATADADAAIADAAKKAFLEACTKNEDCQTGLFCKDFPSKGSFCSKSCTTATASTDCPAPSPGCNKDGICRAP